MSKFVVGTFLMLGWGFYELSGGADFVPETRPVDTISVATTPLASVPFDEPVVARAAAIELPALTIENAATVEAEIVQATVTINPVKPIVEVAPVVDLRTVAGRRVNMRQGPGTNFGVVDTLDRGTQTEVIAVNDDGWAQVVVTNTGQTGWMAERLLSDS